ncbi:MAG: hypothetical protein ACPG49_08710, partial [Chitinophagales bacterium]
QKVFTETVSNLQQDEFSGIESLSETREYTHFNGDEVNAFDFIEGNGSLLMPSIIANLNRKRGNNGFSHPFSDNPFNVYAAITKTENKTNKNAHKQAYHSTSKNTSLAQQNFNTTTSKNTQITINSNTNSFHSSAQKEGDKLMELNNKWVNASHLTKGGTKDIDYPYGPPVKDYVLIPENDFRNMRVEDLPQEMEIIPLNENILQVKDASTDRSEVTEEEMAEQLLKERKESILKEKEEKKTPPRKPKKKKKQWLWMDLVVSPNYVIKNLSAYDNSLERNEYVNERLRTEQSKFGYTLGLRASFRLHDVSEIRTGILYSKITENFKYQREPSTDPLTGVVTTYPLEVSKNKYQFVDIPILIGYREDRKVFDFNVNFGILLNLAFSQEGRILDPYGAGSIDVKGTSEAPIFQTRSGLALYGSIGYNYKFSDKVHLLIEPSLKYVIRPINHWEFPTRQRFHTFGLTTGLRVNIGR